MSDKTDSRRESNSTRRWFLVPDEDVPRRWLWVWDGQAEDDMDELFSRVSDGVATDEDHELFDACMLDRFIDRVYAGETIEPWILKSLAEAFVKVLLGSEWNDEIQLPGRPRTPLRSPKDERALQIYCSVTNAVNREGCAVTKAIESAADSHAVSYETARADYYRWKDWFSKNDANNQKDREQTGE